MFKENNIKDFLASTGSPGSHFVCVCVSVIILISSLNILSKRKILHLVKEVVTGLVGNSVLYPVHGQIMGLSLSTTSQFNHHNRNTKSQQFRKQQGKSKHVIILSTCLSKLINGKSDLYCFLIVQKFYR